LSEGVRVDKMTLGLDDVNLQTEELYCNYSVLVRVTGVKDSRRFLS